MSIFSEVPLFSELPDDAIAWLSGRAQSRQYPRNTIVLAEGQPGNELLIVESGRIKVYVSNADGRELVLYHAGAGDYVGELSIIDGESRSATVKTMEKSSFLVLNQNDLRELMQRDPDFAMVIVQTLTRKLRIATDQVRSLGLDPVYRRLTSLLSNKAIEEADSGLQVVEKISHRQIADQIGSSREMVSKLMRDLEQGEYIICDGDRIVLKGALPASW